MVLKNAFGCSAARDKGRAICANTRIIPRSELLARVLDALQNHLMDSEAVRVFCEGYTAERNRLNASADSERTSLENEQRPVIRDHAKLVDAIIADVRATVTR